MQILSNEYNIFREQSHGCYISNVKLSIGTGSRKEFIRRLKERSKNIELKYI